jgi:macrolide transport system ATP-binding/permease protein
MNLRWLMRAFRRKSELSEELESHLRMAIDDRMARGESAAEAHNAALREFGNVALVQEVTRERWGWLRLEHLLQDTSFAFRQMRRSPGFSMTAILTLALGIGAATAMFVLVYEMFLRPLPFPEEQRLYQPIGIDAHGNED